MTRSVTILGSTGSVGRSTVAVLEETRARLGRDSISVEAVVAHSDADALAAQAVSLGARAAAVADERALPALRAALSGSGVAALGGPSGVHEAAARPADWVMSAIVGAAGLEPTLAAIRRGAAVALANKECLVCAGDLMRSEARRAGATLLPVDSEHSAVFQVLQQPSAVERVTLTASGGPFRTWTRDAMARATPEQAVAHPNWKMGAKISVDSATLMNKGLELIEAAYLFDLTSEALDVVVHPQSIVHALVAYCDGSVLAQLAAPDMRIPIACALAWPQRAPLSGARLDLARIGSLTFEAPDLERFPALALARAALEAGGGSPAALNAANEEAVVAFLDRRIGFLDIPAVVAATLDRLYGTGDLANAPDSYASVMAVDAQARAIARQAIAARPEERLSDRAADRPTAGVIG